jgi:hypothetical protein
LRDRRRAARGIGSPVGGRQRVDRSAIIKTLISPPPEDKVMARSEETDGAPTAPDPVEADETDPDKDASATPTDDAGDPQNADLNAGALSQPTNTGTP